MAASQRERQRQERHAVASARQHERHLRMAVAQSMREIKAADKQARADYLALRLSETADLNAEVTERLTQLQGVLAHTLDVDDRIDFKDLRPPKHFAPFTCPADLHAGAFAILDLPPVQSSLQKVLPGASAAFAAAMEAYVAEIKANALRFAEKEASKLSQRTALRNDYDTRRAAFEEALRVGNADIDEFEQAYFGKSPTAVVAYNDMVLTRSEYPEDGFPQQFRIAYDADSAVMAIEYDLPNIAVVPEEAEYRYVKTKDAIESKPRKPAEIKQIYPQLIAEIALRTMHEVFEADQGNAVSVLALTGILDGYDPATGRDTRVPILSVRSTREAFLQLRLDRIDALACLRSMGASVSARPEELLAVKPVIEFDMVDKRFIDQADALSGLESRPNLMELSPADFEVVVANLFGKMGLQTKLTRSSRDGGVDAIAFDSRPVLGGKVIIQAKRYHGTVGVSAVRDLYGTMMNEGANKGILVATSRYGSDAYTFASAKPIELIDGSNLLYLLREHAGLEARIVATK